MSNSPTSNTVILSAARNLYDFSPDDLVEELKAQGLPVFRAKQVLTWLYKDLATDFSAMTNLPSDLRRRLAGQYRIGSAEVVTQQVSSEGDTRKVLLRFGDGSTVEAVLMLYYDRATVCVSSQVGCAMGCVFCATGQMGFTRNLTPGEMVEQVLVFSRWLRQNPYNPPAPPAPPTRPQPPPLRPMIPPPRGRRPLPAGNGRPGVRLPVPYRPLGRRPAQPLPPPGPPPPPRPLDAVTNVVFMGMGEPMLNYDNLWQAIRTLNSPDALVMGARRMTVSTVGVVPRIRRFTREDLPVNLAISLHAPNDELRTRLVPLNERYPLADLMAACGEYIEATHRRLTFEYALIAGENDSLETAEELGRLLSGMNCHVNLIPLNPVPGTGLAATPREQVRAFAATVAGHGVACTVRIERGQDIAAACGQLKVEHEPNSRRRSLNPELVARTEPLALVIPAHEI
ncbi:MAG: 23S rRNA (adenine(2503)-C(2))-methyltransferase RlmN [Chloroflexia bacterium]